MTGLPTWHRLAPVDLILQCKVQPESCPLMPLDNIMLNDSKPVRVAAAFQPMEAQGRLTVYLNDTEWYGAIIMC